MSRTHGSPCFSSSLCTFRRVSLRGRTDVLSRNINRPRYLSVHNISFHRTSRDPSQISAAHVHCYAYSMTPPLPTYILFPHSGEIVHHQGLGPLALFLKYYNIFFVKTYPPARDRGIIESMVKRQTESKASFRRHLRKCI